MSRVTKNLLDVCSFFCTSSGDINIFTGHFKTVFSHLKLVQRQILSPFITNIAELHQLVLMVCCFKTPLLMRSSTRFAMGSLICKSKGQQLFTWRAFISTLWSISNSTSSLTIVKPNPLILSRYSPLNVVGVGLFCFILPLHPHKTTPHNLHPFL